MWACIPVDVSRLALVRLRQKQYTFSYFKINILNTRSDCQKMSTVDNVLIQIQFD